MWRACPGLEKNVLRISVNKVMGRSFRILLLWRGKRRSQSTFSSVLPRREDTEKDSEATGLDQ
jgi:hypothetical protein